MPTRVFPEVWPTIGGAVCDWIEAYLVHGPGPVAGSPVELTPEEQRFIFQMYEVHPDAPCGKSYCDCRPGRFRYDWSIYCRLKGARKSELAAWLAHAELFGPCRFGGWDTDGYPIPVSIYELGGTADIPFAATAEDQAKDTSWSSFHYIAQHCAHAASLEVTKDRVTVRSGGAGNARVVTSSSIARDGGRPTFTVEEETHLWILPELRELDRVLDFNLAKLGSLDPHGLKVSTMYGVGEGSVFEMDHRRWEESPEDSGILLDIRSAPDGLNPRDEGDILAGIRAAKGDAVWLDDQKLFQRFKRQPEAAQRFWWNKRTVSEKRAVNPDDWQAMARTDREVLPGESICIGFDGSIHDDSTALIACCLSDGFQFPLLILHPDGTEEGVMELRAEVDRVLYDAAARYHLVRMYADPPFWSDQMARWVADFGSTVVVPWWTNRDLAMAWATHRWSTGIAEKSWSHSGDAEFSSQVINAHKRATRIVVDRDTGRYGWVPTKERLGSPRKVDAAVASVLAYEARYDSIRSGALTARRKRRVYAF